MMRLWRQNVKKIETGNSSFEKLITKDNLYVDKTGYLYDLLTDGGTYYFLSRPRRFGKSLTLSTLEAIFKGKRDLFKGLYIESTDYDWKEYPVIHIDFSRCARTSSDEVKVWINKKVMSIASSYGVKLNEDDGYDINLDLLITELAERNKVVVLIDEYDSLLTNNINNKELEEIRLALRGFYSILKGQGENIRMCFITGVTKFSKMSIFSAMNNLMDISVMDDYSSLFGYTQEELEKYFAEYIEDGAKKNGVTREEYLGKLKYWYDGYRFTVKGEAVYNPVSIGSFFCMGGMNFMNYWIQTGGMTMLLAEVAKRVKFDVSVTEETRISMEKLHTVDIIQMAQTEVSRYNFLSLLYQTGYLTIKEAVPVMGSYLITLGYPNEEVEKGLNEILLPAYLGSASRSFDSLVLLDYFDMGNVCEAMKTLISIFAAIPYYELVFDRESAWHAGFVCMMNILEADIIAEAPTNKGRIDCVLKCPGLIYIIEFKFDQSADNAIEQIKEKKYYEPYLKDRKPLHLLGINFSTEEKNIVEWKEETL